VPSCRPAAAGDSGRIGGVESRMGGVPNLGGDVPREFDSAAARADMPGPWPGGTMGAAPGRGVMAPDASPLRGDAIDP
jgi:hypothetical protein